MSPPTDIIVSARGTSEFPVEPHLSECVDSLYQHTRQFRLILVDDNSEAGDRDKIEQIAARHRDNLLIRTHYQRWFTRAYNLGLRMARTPWAVCLNSDTVLGEGWLDELYAVAEDVGKHGKVGLVGSILSEPEQRRWFLSNNPDYVTGHAWLLNMQALYEASASRGQPGIYLDETKEEMIHIRSDIEICWTMNRLGWLCVKSFKSAVGHKGGKSWGQQLHRIMGLRLSDVSDHYY